MPGKNYKPDDEMLEKIIAAAYKDAPLTGRLKIYFLTRKNAGIKKIYDEYRNTAENVKKIHLDEYPGSVTGLLKVKMLNEKKSFILKPAYVFTISFLVITGLLAVLMFRDKEEEVIYTKTEIEIAEEQVKESLAIVNRIFKKTENLIQEEVLPKRVGKPIHKSLSIINEVLTGG